MRGNVLPTRHQSGTAPGTHGATAVPRRQDLALVRQLVDVRRLRRGVPVEARVAVPKVVHEEHNDVRRWVSGRCSRRGDGSRRGRECRGKDKLHGNTSRRGGMQCRSRGLGFVAAESKSKSLLSSSRKVCQCKDEQITAVGKTRAGSIVTVSTLLCSGDGSSVGDNRRSPHSPRIPGCRDSVVDAFVVHDQILRVMGTPHQ